VTAIETRSQAAAAPVRRSLLRNGDFVRLWTGETISQLGTQITVLAIPLVAIEVLHATTLQVGLLSAAEFAPFLVVGLIAGALVDRMRRRRVLIAGDLGRAIALGSIPLAHAFGILSLGQLFVVVVVSGVLTVFFDVAYQSYLPALVDREQLADGNSKLELSRSGAQIAGPGLAGLLIHAVGGALAVLIDAASYVASALAVTSIRRREPAPEPLAHDAPRPKLRTEIHEGLRYVLGHRHLRWMAACTAISNLFSSLVGAVLIVFAVRQLGLSAGAIGLIFTLGNVGFLLGAALANRVTDRLGVGRAIWMSIAFCSGGYFLIAFAPASTAALWFIAALFIVSFGSPIYNINTVSYRQTITPDRLLGRMNATMRFMVWGTMPIGSVLGGVLGTLIGLRPTLLVGAIGGMTAVLPVLLSDVRKIEVMPIVALEA
jgi:MFS family permease